MDLKRQREVKVELMWPTQKSMNNVWEKVEMKTYKIRFFICKNPI